LFVFSEATGTEISCTPTPLTKDNGHQGAETTSRLGFKSTIKNDVTLAKTVNIDFDGDSELSDDSSVGSSSSKSVGMDERDFQDGFGIGLGLLGNIGLSERHGDGDTIGLDDVGLCGGVGGGGGAAFCGDVATLRTVLFTIQRQQLVQMRLLQSLQMQLMTTGLVDESGNHRRIRPEISGGGITVLPARIPRITGNGKARPDNLGAMDEGGAVVGVEIQDRYFGSKAGRGQNELLTGGVSRNCVLDDSLSNGRLLYR